MPAAGDEEDGYSNVELNTSGIAATNNEANLRSEGAASGSSDQPPRKRKPKVSKRTSSAFYDADTDSYSKREGAYRDLPLAVRFKNFTREYRISTGFMTVASLTILALGAINPVDGFDWKSYVTLECTCLSLTLMLNNQPPDLVILRNMRTRITREAFS